MPTLTENGCLDRQNRFRARLAEHHIDAAVLMDCRDVYYFTGKLLPDTFRFSCYWRPTEVVG